MRAAGDDAVTTYPVGPVDLTAGHASLKMPAAADLLLGIALYNNSQYLLQVGNNSQWVQPFSPAWVDVTDANPSSLEVAPIQFGGQLIDTSGQVLTGTWYSNDEEPPALLPFAADPITVAQASNQLGIPNIFLNSLVAAYATIFGNALQPGASFQIDVYKYATLTFSVNSNPAGKVQLQIETHSAVTGGPFDTVLGREYYSVNDITVSGTFALPVLGSSIVVQNNSTNPVQLIIFGNNRPLPSTSAVNLGGQNTPRVFTSASVAAPASSTKIPINTADSGPSSTSFNGTTSFRVAVTVSAGGAKPSFLIQMVYYDPNAARVVTIIDSASLHAVEGVATEWDFYGTFEHPAAVVGWQALMSASSTATVRFFLEFIPS